MSGGGAAAPLLCAAWPLPPALTVAAAAFVPHLQSPPPHTPPPQQQQPPQPSVDRTACRLYECAAPLLPPGDSDSADAAAAAADAEPICRVPAGLRFVDADAAAGPWRNFFVGLVGGVAAAEDEALWPNQLLHRDRMLFNVRSGADVAVFLAEARRADVEAHAANLERLAAERGYRRGWCWHALCMRWGRGTLERLGVGRRLV